MKTRLLQDPLKSLLFLALSFAGCEAHLSHGGEVGLQDAGSIDGGVEAATSDAAVDAPDAFVDAGPLPLTARAGMDVQAWSGLNLLLDGSDSTSATSFVWQQTEGDPIIAGPTDRSRLNLRIPRQANVGTRYTFRLQVRDASNAMAEDSVSVQVIEPAFENFLGGISSTDQLNNSEGIVFKDDRMLVVSFRNPDPSFLSAFNSSGSFVQKWPLGASSAGGATVLPDGNLLIAHGGDVRRLDIWNSNSMTTSILATELNGGGSVGTANCPVVDRAGNIFISTRETGTILRYDAATREVRVFASNLIEHPNGIAFGPEDNMLYVGGIGGVLRVEIRPDGTAGSSTRFVPALVGGNGCEVDGITFDNAGNIWFGCPNEETLFIASKTNESDAEASITREFRGVGQGFSYFVNLRFGNGSFGDNFLYYTNLGSRTVGRFAPGTRAPTLPLPPP